MDNKVFYTAIKKMLDYYRKKEKSDEGLRMIKTEFPDLQEKDFEEYREDFDYKKIFLKSYYRRFFDTTPSLDYEGKEIHWEARMVAEIMFRELMMQFADCPEKMMELSQYILNDDIGIDRYQELLKKHDLL